MSASQPTKLGIILNTRPAHYHERFHEAFGDLPWAIFDCPLTRANPVSANLPGPDAFDTLIFTSQMGVDLFFYDPRWHAKRVLTVGEATGQLAAKFGYPDVICTGETVDDLRRYLNTNPFTKAFYPSATDVTAPLEKEFPEKVERVPIYQMVARDGLPPQFIDQALRLRIVVPFFSRRNAEIFADLAAKAGLTKNNTAILAVGMGADTFVDLDGPWQSSVTAAKPTMNYMVATTDMAISRMSM